MNSHRLAPRSSRGFTLVELLTVLAVISILVSAAVPMFSGIAETMRLNAAARDFMAHLQFARGEAIKRNARVALCPSADGVSCAAGGRWEQGWLVFQDSDNNGLRDGGEPLLQQAAALAPGYRMRGNQNLAQYVSFHPSAETRTTSGAFQAGTLTVCRTSASPASARQIVLNAAGRPRTQSATLAACG
jgi:type IV fimbrial biogenesis protein FimT